MGRGSGKSRPPAGERSGLQADGPQQGGGLPGRGGVFCLPPLTLGQYTGFVQPIEPRPIRRLAIELEINQHHGAEERAADAAGKAQLRQQVIAGLYARRCEQARQLAQARLILCLGTG